MYYYALHFVLLLSNRYQQYESEFEPVEISTPRYEPERYYKPEYQTERSSYDYNKPEFQTERYGNIGCRGSSSGIQN